MLTHFDKAYIVFLYGKHDSFAFHSRNTLKLGKSKNYYYYTGVGG